jgi:predicted transposase/invertase (TIGR01784 family)
MHNNKNPHDKLFKTLMREKVFAQAFMQQHFSKKELSLIDIYSLQLCSASFLNVKGDEYHSDIVYQVNMAQQGTGYVIFLFEHQSQPDKLLAFRLLEYQVFLMRQHIQQGHSQLPVVMSVVFYNGVQSPYPYSTDILDCFENPELAREYTNKPFKLIDVTTMSDETLKNNIVTAPAQIIMKHIRDKDLFPFFKVLAEEGILEKNAQINSGKLVVSVVNYIIKNGEISDPDAFEELLLTSSGETRKDIMTIFEQHQKEKQEQFNLGLQEGEIRGEIRGEIKGEIRGEIRGEVKGKLEVAKNMLIQGNFSLEVIATVTGLSLEQIKALKSEIEH